MARKHLRELLVEDQEPFLLDAYISDLRRQLKKPPKPPAHRKASSLGESLLKNANACFSSSSPVPPRFDAAADASCDHAKMVGNSTVLLRVPTRTAALLLEAALRIENCDSKDRGDLPDCKKQGKPGGGGSTGESLFRKFVKFGRRSREKEFGDRECRDGVLVRDILRLGNSRERKRQGKASASKETSRQVGDCPCSTSESTQGRGRESDGDSEGSELGRSPFRYPTPELGSLAASPARSLPMDKVNDEESDRPDELEEESEVEKEQSSPISVLDPPLYNDEDTVRRNGRAEDSDNNDGYSYEFEHEHGDDIDYEAGYTSTKQQLLRKLYMFERLAGIDHVELEGRRLTEHDDEDEDGDVRPRHDSAREMTATRGMMRLVSGLVVVGGGEEQWPNEEEEQHQPLEDAAEEIEVSILGCLVEELSDELCPERSF